MVHHVYRVENGCLVRFSLLPGGAVKKAQVLGGKLRLMSFEWTHLACPREVYEVMVERMELKVPLGVDAGAAVEKVAERYGLAGKAGFLHPGMGLPEVEGLIGAATGVEGEAFRWAAVDGEYHCELRAVVRGRALVRMETDGFDQLRPVVGSLTWVEESIGIYEDDSDDPFGDLDMDRKLKVELVPAVELEAALLKLAAGLTDWDWARWNAAAGDLVRVREVESGRLVAAALRCSQGSAGELGFYDCVEWGGRRAWVEKWLRRFLVDGGGAGSDVSRLLGWLERVDGACALEIAQLYAESGRVEFYGAVVHLLPRFEAALAEDFVVEALGVVLEEGDWELGERVLRSVVGMNFGDVGRVRAAVERLPVGRDGGSWFEVRELVLDGLGVG